MAKGFCCINARAIDFAKLGRLYLNKGNWNGKQIVSEAWVDSSVTVKDYRNYYLYTYQWWHTRDFSIQRDSLPIEGIHQVLNVRKTDKDKGTRTVIRPSGDFLRRGIWGSLFMFIRKRTSLLSDLEKNTE